jgi:hypothetical protein
MFEAFYTATPELHLANLATLEDCGKPQEFRCRGAENGM